MTSFFKTKALRSPAYRRYVACFACSWCGVEGWSQAAHENRGKGMGLKACDSRTFPLCAPRFGVKGCHQQFDAVAGMGREQKREMAERWVARTQEQAVRDGWDFSTLTRG